MTNIKYFGISVFKQIKLLSTDTQTKFVSTSKRQCQIIDFATPGDQNIAIKEQEKIDKYQHLRKVKIVIILVVIGVLRTMLKRIHQYITQTDIPDIISI